MNITQSFEVMDFFGASDVDGFQEILPKSKKFDEWDIDSLVHLLSQAHLDTRDNVIRIYDLAQAVCVKHSGEHSELSALAAALFLFFHDLLVHLRKEEQTLFPNIVRLTKGTLSPGSAIYTTFGLVKESVIAMRKEHEGAVDELKFFRQLTNDYLIPGDACTSYKHLFEKMKAFEKDLMFQIELENGILFPKAIQVAEKSIETK